MTRLLALLLPGAALAHGPGTHSHGTDLWVLGAVLGLGVAALAIRAVAVSRAPARVRVRSRK